jgi:hypothetical protein
MGPDRRSSGNGSRSHFKYVGLGAGLRVLAVRNLLFASRISILKKLSTTRRGGKVEVSIGETRSPF